MVVLVAIAVAVGAGDLVHSAPRTLSGAEVASQIATDLQVQQHDTTPPQVRCPSSEPVRTGWQFSCALVQRGTSETLDVVEIDSQGGLRWQIAPGPSS
jgi:hypothetical protein